MSEVNSLNASLLMSEFNSLNESLLMSVVSEHQDMLIYRQYITLANTTCNKTRPQKQNHAKLSKTRFLNINMLGQRVIKSSVICVSRLTSETLNKHNSKKNNKYDFGPNITHVLQLRTDSLSSLDLDTMKLQRKQTEKTTILTITI